MVLNDEQLKSIEEFAAFPQFTIQDVANIIEVDGEELMRQILLLNTDAAKAHKTGSLKASAEFGKKVTVLSNQGSGPAQTLMAKLREKSEVNTLIQYYG